jgi:metal-dependent HD superfamily phosphatase/phosphodiesterase
MALQIDTRINVATVGSILAVAIALGLYVGRMEASYAVRMDAAEAAICEIKQEQQRGRENAIKINVVMERVDGIYRLMKEFKDEFRRGVRP